ncbi:MAG TPA: immunity 53 family protein [Solirubrobacteraceae bacterium]
MPDTLIGLQDWYSSQCDGAWEHSYGIQIGTLDNPGWRVRIDLERTSVVDLPFERVEVHNSERDWLVCWVEDRQFHAACGSHNLIQSLDVFLRWSET